MKFRHILEVFCLQVLKKKFWAQFHDLRIQKRSCLSWNSDAFWKFSACKLKKKLLAQFHDLCVQKRSCLLWNSDAFWKFSACKFYRKSFGRNSTISVLKNEAVCYEVQTHFGSFHLTSFVKKVLGAFIQFMCPKTKLFAVKFRRVHFGSSCFARFVKKIQGALSRFVHPKMKLFAVMLRHISEVLRLQGSQRKFWTNFHNVCVQQRSCLLFSSDAFCKLSACTFDKKLWAYFHDLCVAQTNILDFNIL